VVIAKLIMDYFKKYIYIIYHFMYSVLYSAIDWMAESYPAIK